MGYWCQAHGRSGVAGVGFEGSIDLNEEEIISTEIITESIAVRKIEYD